MNRVGEFEKVSFEQYYKDILSVAEETSEEDARDVYESIKLPVRATMGSAGYDFKAPFGFDLEVGESIKIPTGIRVRIDEGWWLECLPRSSLGFKYRVQLDNTVGVIDQDYYHSSNEGHIFLKITNDGKYDKHVSVNAGDGFAQAIFTPYGITYSDAADGIRDGGMGSTGK